MDLTTKIMPVDGRALFRQQQRDEAAVLSEAKRDLYNANRNLAKAQRTIKAHNPKKGILTLANGAEYSVADFAAACGLTMMQLDHHLLGDHMSFNAIALRYRLMTNEAHNPATPLGDAQQPPL